MDLVFSAIHRFRLDVVFNYLILIMQIVVLRWKKKSQQLEPKLELQDNKNGKLMRKIKMSLLPRNVSLKNNSNFTKCTASFIPFIYECISYMSV